MPHTPPVSARELIARHTTLFSLPAIVLRLNEMVNDPDMSAADIGAVISQDPALSLRLLKIVNSPFYGFPSQIDSISLAVTIVGIRQLRDLVLATALVDQFGRMPSRELDIETFWRHSLTSAMIARALANRMKVSNPERYFIAGLLHDIGLLVMEQEAHPSFDQAGTDRLLAEEAHFGFTHAELGAELLRQWRLPAPLIEAVACHHAPLDAEQFLHEAACVNLANTIALYLQPGPHGDINTVPSPPLWACLQLSEDCLPELLEEINAQLEDTLHLLYYSQAA